jgi:protein-S-isoprenylcysteine O-methyltransferase Ste14
MKSVQPARGPVRREALAPHAPGPGRRSPLLQAWHLLSTVAGVSLFAIFAAVHMHRWVTTGEPTGLGLVAQEALAAVLFLLRRRPVRSTVSPLSWIVAAGGSWLILAARPAGAPLLGLGSVALLLQFAGLAAAVLGLGVLGRSFGIVAADRGVRTAGPYRLVRHPIYAAYLLTQLGYLLQNPSLWNLAIVATVTACQIGRIQAEESVLKADEGYRTYALQVRYRLVPGLY